MRLAFLHRQLVGGGTEADLVRMAAGLTDRGHEVHVYCARPAAAPPGVVVHRVPVVRAGRTARLLAFAVAAPRQAARERFDLVVGFGRTLRQDVVRVGGGTHRTYLARMRAAGLRAPVLGPYHRAILWLERRMFAPGAVRGVVAVSARVRDEVVADYAVPAARVHVVYNGVDLARFDPARRARDGAAARRRLGLAPAEPVCLAVGSGFARKGFDLLLALWRERPPRDARLLLAGGDERLAHYRREAAREPLAGRVAILGRRDDVPELMAIADVVCVPSRQEAFGNVVLEAAAAGVPVVTSRLVGAAELLCGPLGALVVERPDDLAALGAALAEALGAQREAYGRAARALAETRPWERHVAELEAVLARVAHG